MPNPIGVLEAGLTKEGIRFERGMLTISEPMPTPVIRQLKRWQQSPENAIVILDAPPGASCAVVETLRAVDFVLLVTEPTPFGVHDMKQMLGIVQEMSLPAGVVINRCGIGDGQMDEFLAQNNLPVLLRVPFTKELASGIAAGQNLIDVLPEYSRQLQHVHRQISEMLGGGEPC